MDVEAAVDEDEDADVDAEKVTDVPTSTITYAPEDNTWTSCACVVLLCMGRRFTVRHWLISSCTIVAIILITVLNILCLEGDKNDCDDNTN